MRCCGISGSSRRHMASVAVPPLSALCTSHRSFVANKLEQFVAKKITPALEKLKKGTLVFADERLVTEPRRKLVRQPAMAENLTERLARQRRVQQGLVPSEIRVDRSKLSVTFMWPLPAVEQVHRTAHHSTRADERKEEQQLRKHHDDADHFSDATTMKTTALAEYLRVMTPSTDGTFATDRVVYGRRGVTIKTITPIGNYAVRIGFSDGHDAGIYSYDYLFHLTSPDHKYRLMREYIRALRATRKSREPPRRAASARRLERTTASHQS